MQYKIKPFVVSITDNLGLGTVTSYVAEAIEATVNIQEKIIGKEGVTATIVARIYEKVIYNNPTGVNGNEEYLERLELRDTRVISTLTLSNAGLTLDQQGEIFKTLVFGSIEEQALIVEQLIATFGLELLYD